MTAEEAIQIAELVSALDRRSWDAARVKSWAGILQRAALVDRLPAELLLLTAEELLREVEACDVSPAKLLKRAKEKPPKLWLEKRKRLTGPVDDFPPLFYPEGEGIVRTSKQERKAMSDSWSRWRESPMAARMRSHQKGLRGSVRAREMTAAGSVEVKAAIEQLKKNASKAQRPPDPEPF